MTKEQYETLNSICCTLNVLSHAGEAVSGLAHDMGQTCRILEEKLLDFIEQDAEEYRRSHVVDT